MEERKVGLAKITRALIKDLFNFPGEVQGIYYNYEDDTFNFVLEGEDMPVVQEGEIAPLVGKVFLNKDDMLCFNWQGQEYYLLERANKEIYTEDDFLNNIKTGGQK